METGKIGPSMHFIWGINFSHSVLRVLGEWGPGEGGHFWLKPKPITTAFYNATTD